LKVKGVLKLLAEQQVIKLMNEKGYRFSTFQEFERDSKHILNGSVQQYLKVNTIL